MSVWWPWVMMLAGVNLTRLQGRGWLWGVLVAVGTLAWKAFGGASGTGWLAWVVGAATAGTVPVLWGHWSLSGRQGRTGLGLAAGAAGAADLGRGEAIGVLERWIALVMVVRGDYAALGFLMAAKALARHKRFEDDPAFAEYFLVGTLGSVLAAIAVGEGLALWTRFP